MKILLHITFCFFAFTTLAFGQTDMQSVDTKLGDVLVPATWDAKHTQDSKVFFDQSAFEGDIYLENVQVKVQDVLGKVSKKDLQKYLIEKQQQQAKEFQVQEISLLDTDFKKDKLVSEMEGYIDGVFVEIHSVSTYKDGSFVTVQYTAEKGYFSNLEKNFKSTVKAL